MKFRYDNPYTYGGASGLGGYGGNYVTEFATTQIPERYPVIDWEEYYVPTEVGGPRVRRPVIYIAAPLPAANQCSGFGGYGASMPYSGGFGSSMPYSGGFGAGMPYSGGYGSSMPYSGGFGSSMPFSGGMGGGFPYGGAMAGANLGYQALPMMTVAYGGGIPGVGGVSPLGGLGGGVPLF